MISLPLKKRAMKFPRPTRFRSLICSALLLVSTLALHANTALEPQPRDPKWVKRHVGFVDEAKQGGVDVLFMGDSITDFWRNEGPVKGGRAIWDKEYAPLHAANFGISGDRTQHVLWRMQNGELQGLNPKVVVLMIGTNNMGLEPDKKTVRNTEAEVVEGITAVVKEIRSRLPNAKVLLLGVFPRGEKDTPIRAEVKAVNASIAKLADDKKIFFLDFGDKFLEADGTLSKEIMPDLLHPTMKGYQIWADVMRAPLAKLLK